MVVSGWILTNPYNVPDAVIPAKAGIRVKKTEFRIKSGMTIL